MDKKLETLCALFLIKLFVDCLLRPTVDCRPLSTVHYLLSTVHCPILFVPKPSLQQTPPKDSKFFYSKNPDWCPNWGEPHNENSGRGILYGENLHRKNPYREKFEKFLQGQTVFFLTQWIQNIWFHFWLFQLNLIELWKKLGIHLFSRMFSEKFPDSSVTIWMFHAQCSLL